MKKEDNYRPRTTLETESSDTCLLHAHLSPSPSTSPAHAPHYFGLQSLSREMILENFTRFVPGVKIKKEMKQLSWRVLGEKGSSPAISVSQYPHIWNSPSQSLPFFTFSYLSKGRWKSSITHEKSDWD